MFSVLNICGLKIASYGLVNLIAFTVGIVIACLRAKKNGISPEQEFLMLLHALIGAIVGGKLLYLICSLGDIWNNKAIIFKDINHFTSYMEGGFVFYGGLLGGLAAAFLYCHYYKKPPVKMIELSVPSIPLIHGIGRIGCFMAGCCYGIPVKSKISVVYTNSIAAPNGIPIFPIQLLEAGINFTLFIILMIYSQKPHKPYKLLGLYLTFYSIERFFLEFLRGDSIRGVYWGISSSQWISLIIILPLGIFLFTSSRLKN
ncbi:prolipoprotein diacylglyceryl transferase [Aminipila terrae]|uniref:Phosphatidylglycerol--prolipoprotein diacylglyceryl transferase n=1 Tax=Aminipila terrae TaxID=2697030 RepID=A0A6P1MGT1_9FIRM|nr:prolipoprotein diacylglyceryl transferase family protein [Aminipila terrae]QHI71784.1 prolipoprotein diacylglyceryl transferase [Aminipila terrae]